MRKKLIVVLTLVALLMGIMPVYAEMEPKAEENPVTKTEASNQTNIPQIDCTSYIVIDGGSGKVLFGKDYQSKQFPASTTKIMTAIIALEQNKLDEVVTVGPNPPNVDGTKLYLREGEKVKLEDLLYAAIVYSANDAALAIGEYVGGTEEKFVQMMNEKAKEIGMKNTTFNNPHGLTDDLHVTTAEDLAILGRYAMDNPTYKKMAGTQTYNWEGELWQSVLGNKNQLLKKMPEATGVKNGYTSKAKYTLVGSAEKNGQELIGVILGSPSEQIYNDMATILNFGFNNYKSFSIVDANEQVTTIKFDDKRSVSAITEKGIAITLNKDSKEVVKKEMILDDIILPIEKGQPIGKIIATVDDQEVDHTVLVASDSVNKPTNWLLMITLTISGIYVLQMIYRMLIMGRKKRRGLSFKPVSKKKNRG